MSFGGGKKMKKGIDYMRESLGLQEVKDRSKLKSMFRDKSIKDDILVDPSNTPWCSAQMNWCERMAGHAGTGKLNARSWLNMSYGKVVYDRDKKIGKVTDAEPGDLAVWERGTDGWSGHINYIETVKPGSFICLGGNQNNAVTREAYPITNKLLGIRRSK